MQEFWKLVFDEMGLVRDQLGCDYSRQVAAVRAIRQVCFLLYKLEGSCGKEEEDLVIDNFVDTENSLPEVDDEVCLSPNAKGALERASTLIHRVVGKINPYDILPRHGPGAVATG
jgi:hypothetical protein